FVDMHSDNKATFSYEFSSILRDCGSISGSIMDAWLRGTAVGCKTKLNIVDYRDFLRSYDMDIHRRSVQVFSNFPNGIIVPFEEFKEPKGVPRWWDAYNKV